MASGSERYKIADKTAPQFPEELTAEWMTEAMRAAGTIADSARATSVDLGSLGGDGRPMTGELVRCTMEYEPVGAGPEHVVAKFASRERIVKGLIEQSNSYAREIYFYRDLAESVPIRAPRHYGSGLTPGRSRDSAGAARIVDALPAWFQLILVKDPTKLMRPTKRHYALLLEDCSGGTVVYNMVTPPSVEKLSESLGSLAKLHAAYWGGADQVAGHPSLGWLGTRTPKLYNNELRLRSLEVAREHWSDWWQDSHTEMVLDAGARLIKDIPSVNEPLTLVHGDPRSDNWLFAADGGDEPIVLDWTLQAIGHPAWDVSYVLSSSVESRDLASVPSLVDGYLEALRSEGVHVDSDDFWKVIRAGWRVQVVLMALSVRVTSKGYGDAAFYDFWGPRVISLLEEID